MFSYRVKYGDNRGAIETRIVQGSSPKSVRQQMAEDGYTIFNIERAWSLSFQKKLKPRAFLAFNKELKNMIRSGLPVVQGLDLVLKRSKGPLGDILKQVRSDLTRGKALSEAFQAHIGRIPTYYPALIYAGEQSGNLEEVLDRFISQENRLQRAKKKFRNALSYPVFLLVVGMVGLYIIMAKAMPQFAGLYTDSGQELPMITQWAIAFSKIFSAWALPIFIAILTGSVIWFLNKQALWKEKLILKIPLIGHLWNLQNQIIFIRTMRMLLGAGVPMVESLAIAARAMPGRIYNEALLEVRSDLLDGMALERALEKSGRFDDAVLEMIRIGETTGTLNEMLDHLAEQIEERSEDLLELISNVFAPGLLLLVGVTISILVLAMYLPMFGAADLVAGA